MQTEFESQLSNTLIYLERHQPFWSYLTYKLQILPDPEVVTACINGRGVLRICPSFFTELPVHKKAFLIAHETSHLALGLWWRASHHDKRKANYAHDHVVNLLLTDGGRKLDWFIEGGLLDRTFNGLTYEEVYHRLPDPPKGWVSEQSCPVLGTPASSSAAEDLQEI
jgi:hypothetical protein